MTDELDGKQGVQSLEVGMSILRAMAAGKRAMMLKDIAAATEMPPSKVHRYLVSLIRSGLVEQDPMTSRYDLGAFALNLGLVALDRIDRIRLGLNAIVNLRDTVNETTALGVWSPQGPIVIRWERPRRPITVNVVAGTPLAILNSALGRAFAAWLPEAATDAAIQAELATGKGPTGVTTLAGTREFLADIRAQGYSAITGDYYVNGVEAVAAPVFNVKNQVTLALTLVAVEGTMDLSPASPTIRELCSAAHELSVRLGSTLPPGPCVEG